jgi:peptidylprolyl isomerase
MSAKGWLPASLVWAGLAMSTAVAQQDDGPVLRPKANPKPAVRTAGATLLVLCDLACNWKLDGRPQGRITPGNPVIAPVSLGQHLVDAATADGLDKVESEVAVSAVEQTIVHLALQPVRDARLKVAPTVPGINAKSQDRSMAFGLRYQDLRIGTGAEAQPNKLYKVHYTGWLAATNEKFDSSYDHGAPLKDKDGKPLLGSDGQPKLDIPQPMSFPQGFGRVIPGFDQGFAGMRIGGKRRLFIPWQLAYGTREMPGRGPGHPGIPPKSDLIFDVELIDVTDLPASANAPKP